MSDCPPEWFRAVTEGGTGASRAAARLLSFLADKPGGEPEVLVRLHAAPRARMVLGVTGPPGAGKSTLTDALIAEFRKRHPERRIGVLAVDPSSPMTGGAVLGDRVRMMRHAADPLVFIRSLGARGHLGGLSAGLLGMVRVLEAMPCDVILVETVGVGQSETEIRLAADRVLVIVAPGFGDEVQLLKAGLLEIANVFVVTKADRPGAAELHAALGTMVEEEMVPESGACEPRRNGVFLVSAQEGVGVVELADALDKLAAVRCPAWRARRGERTLNAVRRAIVSRAAGRLNDAMDGDPAMTARIQAVLDGSRPLDSAVQELLDSASRREKS